MTRTFLVVLCILATIRSASWMAKSAIDPEQGAGMFFISVGVTGFFQIYAILFAIFGV